MIEISMQTALLIYSLCFIIGFFITLLYSRTIDAPQSVKFFLLFFLFSSIGSLIIIYRNEINNLFISIIIANTFLFFAQILLLHGVLFLVDKKPFKVFVLSGLISFIGLFLYFTYIDFDVVMRIIIYNLYVIIFLSRIVFHLYNLRKETKNMELMTPAILFIIATLIFRIYGVLTFNENTNEFLYFQRDAFNVVFVGIANLLIIIGLFSLINNKISESLIESERSKTSLLSNLPGFAYRCLNDEFWTMKYLSKGFKQVTGYDLEEVIDNASISFEEIIHEEFREDVRVGWIHAIESKEEYLGEYKIKQKDNSEIWVWERGIGIYDETGDCIAIEGFISNIDNRKKMESKLQFLSYRDSLTNLYNRRFVEDQLERLRNSRLVPISILVADVNGLKFINDSFGHTYGDEVIVQVSDVLRSSIRSSEIIARIGGDEFIVVLENTTLEDCEKIVNRIENEIHNLSHKKLGLSIAIGYATKTNPEQTLDEVRKIAEDKMYEQKIYSKPSTRRKAVDAVLKTLFEKDESSERHSQNVAKYGTLLAREIGMSEHDIKQVETAALLHDVGKIIINDSILKSSEKLSANEWQEIKTHPIIGYRILSSVNELKEIADIILAHHERLDGKGYPNKLESKDIPLKSKIISICDAFDAMVHDRLYRDPLSIEEACKELENGKNTQFDSDLVDAFINAIKKHKIK